MPDGPRRNEPNGPILARRPPMTRLAGRGDPRADRPPIRSLFPGVPSRQFSRCRHFRGRPGQTRSGGTTSPSTRIMSARQPRARAPYRSTLTGPDGHEQSRAAVAGPRADRLASEPGRAAPPHHDDPAGCRPDAGWARASVAPSAMVQQASTGDIASAPISGGRSGCEITCVPIDPMSPSNALHHSTRANDVTQVVDLL